MSLHEGHQQGDGTALPPLEVETHLQVHGHVKAITHASETEKSNRVGERCSIWGTLPRMWHRVQWRNREEPGFEIKGAQGSWDETRQEEWHYNPCLDQPTQNGLEGRKIQEGCEQLRNEKRDGGSPHQGSQLNLKPRLWPGVGPHLDTSNLPTSNQLILNFR